jgi:hypothetical protein
VLCGYLVSAQIVAGRIAQIRRYDIDIHKELVHDNRFFENRAVGEGQGLREREDPQCPPRARQRRRLIAELRRKPTFRWLPD